MAVSKRVRFEVLKRDNFTCRYCHKTTNELEVDHVIPQALGGSDKPDNLVAACVDCNRGKTSVSPDAETVDNVSEQALALAKALQLKLVKKTEKLDLVRGFQQEFIDYWYEAADENGLAFAHPEKDWENTLEKWCSIGVPLTLIQYAIDKAFKSRAGQSGKYRYMCGIIWRTLEQAQDEVIKGSEPQPKKRCGHCIGCLHPEEYPDYCTLYNVDDDDTPTRCEICDDPDCVYSIGEHDGEERGWNDAATFYTQHPERLYSIPWRGANDD